ncbi:Centromere/kinetochore Zw10-domain-containing protein [Syncephalis fuscata]|nr:Centromere/kinetochore Zw10-domain-containing protein [Syncephalis fuscata]
MTVEQTCQQTLAVSTTDSTDNTATALENRIIARLAESKSFVYQAIHSFYKDIPNAYKYSLTLTEELKPLNTDIQAFSRMITEDVESNRLAVYQDTAYMLELLIEIHTRLQDFDQALLSNELLSAVSCVHDTLSLINGLSNCKDECDVEVLSLLKSARSKKTSALKACLHRYTSLAVAIARNDLYIRVVVTYDIIDPRDRTGMSNAITLSDLFSALAGIEMLDDELKWLARQFIDLLLRPLLHDSSLQLTIERSRQQAVLTIDRRKSNAMSIDGFDKLLEVARFLSHDILCGGEFSEDNESFTEPFSIIWYHDLVQMLTRDYLQKLIPGDRAELNHYVESMDQMIGFERELRNLDARTILIDDDQNTVFIEDLYLTDNMALMQNDKDTTVKGGKLLKGGKEDSESNESLLGFPTCHISVQTQTLIELVNQTLDKAISITEADEAMELFCCARDLLDLHRAIRPMIEKDERASQYLARGAILYNDCMYIVYHLHAFEYRYGKLLSKPLRSMATFIDLVHTYWSLGHTHFCQLVHQQQEHLEALMASICGLHQLDEQQRSDQVETILKQAIQHVSQIVKSWRILLPKRLYRQSIGSLLNVILDSMIQQVLSLTTLMTTLECYRLRHLFSMIDRLVHDCIVPPSKENSTEAMSAWFKFSQIYTLINPSTSESTRRVILGNTTAVWSSEDKAILKRLIDGISHS